MSRHAFIDESTRRGDYLICVASCTTGDLPTTRTALRELLLPGQRRLHFVSESDQRRRQILSSMSSLATTSVIYTATHRNQRAARHAIIRHAARDLEALGVERLTLESREGQDHFDRRVIHETLGRDPKIHYTHVTAANEAMLWIPDALAWAYGRGGDWRRRVDRLGLIDRVVTVEVP